MATFRNASEQTRRVEHFVPRRVVVAPDETFVVSDDDCPCHSEWDEDDRGQRTLRVHQIADHFRSQPLIYDEVLSSSPAEDVAPPKKTAAAARKGA